MKNISISASSLVWPVKGHITPRAGEFGAPRRHGKPHAGVDFRVEAGTDVMAVADGVVESAFEIEQGPTKEVTYGHVMVVYHGKNLHTGKYTYTLYAHLKSMGAEAGKKVKRGEVIALSGNSGGVGVHLHFEAIEAPEKVAW